MSENFKKNKIDGLMQTLMSKMSIRCSSLPLNSLSLMVNAISFHNEHTYKQEQTTFMYRVSYSKMQ